MEAPNLRTVAIKVLSQTASAGGCERNWSTFNLIHSKRRNKLGEKKLNDLVFVHYNLRLKMKHAREGHDKEDYADPIDLAYIFKMHDDDAEEDVLQSWMDGNGAPVLDGPGGAPNQNISQQMGADVGDYMARSGRITDPVGGLELEGRDLQAAVASVISSGASSSRSKSNSGGDDADEVLFGGTGAGDARSEGSFGGGPRDTRMEEGLQAGREFVYRRRNAHGQDVPSPSRGPGPMDYEGYQSGYGNDSYMEDLISSVGSLSMDVDSPYRPRNASSSPLGGYGSSDNTSFGFFSEDYHAPPPPPSQIQPPPLGPSSYGYGDYYSSYSDENYQSGQPTYPAPSQRNTFGGDSYGFFPNYYPAEPPPPQRSSPTQSSSSQVTSSRRRRTGTSTLDTAYPRIGILVNVSDHDYRQYVVDYKAMYSYMTWENYCEYIERVMQYERRHGGESNMDPARSSSWF